MARATVEGRFDNTEGGEVWGPLHRDADAVDTALAEATSALMRAARAAMWLTKDDYPIQSALADILAGLGSVVDGLIDQRQEANADINRLRATSGDEGVTTGEAR